MLLRSRYLSDTPIEGIEAEVQLDPADVAPASCPGLYREARGAHFVVVKTGERRFRTQFFHGEQEQFGTGRELPPISRQPTWEVHHPEGVFLAHRGN